jgi:hypothetical protein
MQLVVTARLSCFAPPNASQKLPKLLAILKPNVSSDIIKQVSVLYFLAVEH